MSRPQKRIKMAESKKPSGTTTAIASFETVLAVLLPGTSPAGPLFMDCFSPEDCLHLLSVCKSFRKPAVKKLVEYQNKPETKTKQLQLDRWLDRPMFDGETFSGALCLAQIKKHASDLKQQFVVLNYECFYGQETTVAALFTINGEWMDSFTFQSTLDYEGGFMGEKQSETTQVMSQKGKTWFIHGNVHTRIDGGGIGWDSQWVDMDNGRFTDLFCLFDGILSPTEALCVLLHALSSIPTVIFHILFAHLESSSD